MADLYEVLLQDGETTWHAGFLVDDDTETDVLLRSRAGTVPAFRSRAGLEHLAQEMGLELEDELPDAIDLDLGGWLTAGTPEPTTAEVCELWHLLVDDPDCGGALSGEALGEAYDDLVEDAPGRFAEHGPAARPALAAAVAQLRELLAVSD